MKTHHTDSCRSIVRRLAFAVVAMAVVAISSQAQELSAADMGYDYPRTLSDLVVNPTAEATAMLRHQDCPVSYATGTAEISIPLLSCRSGDLEIALSINYHTCGIKVSDESGIIGLGWTLHGLGRVSRQVCVFPDECRPFEREPTTESVKKQLLYEVESNYDRYSYEFPGYSGAFLITEDSLVHMSDNGVRIERMCSSKNKFATDSFAIITPEGIRYTFGQREICRRTHWVANGSGSNTDISYEAPVVWNLTSIRSLITSERITVSYLTGEYDRYDETPITLKYGRKWSHNPSQDCTQTSIASYSDGITRFSGYAIPKCIKGKSFTVDFNGGGGAGITRYSLINKITLRSDNGTEIRRIELESDGNRPDKRLLKGVKISSDGKTIDRHTFTYYDGVSSTGRDFFGYANGSTEYLQSVLDISTLKLNEVRQHNPTLVKAWSLKSMTDVTGAVTTFSYISKQWTPPAGSQNNRLTSVYNGIAVSEIETVDPLTGRYRTRTFRYSEPVMSVPLQFLTTDDFISLSGSKTYEDGFTGDDNWSIYTLTAELTSSCRRPGYPAENMVIYFDKVTENVSGTDIHGSVRTDYEFDNSRCIHESGIPALRNFTMSALSSSTEPRSTSAFSIVLGETIPLDFYGKLPNYGTPMVGGLDEDTFYKLFHTKYTYSPFTERIDPAPLLSKKIIYEYRDGRQLPVETVENFHSSGRHRAWVTGRYVQGNVYKNSFGDEYYKSLNQTGAIDVCNVYAQSDLMRLDSTVTTHHYPDGNSRRIVTRHVYGSLLDGTSADNTVTSDTLDLNPLSPTPHSTVTRFGNEYFLTWNVRSEDIVTPFYRSATQKGFSRLPVIQRWKAVSGVHSDNIEIRQEYSAFGALSPLKSRVTLLKGGETAAVQTIKSYDNKANITSMTEADGTSRSYTWLSAYGLLSTSSIETHNGDLTSKFGHKPFVGCTSRTDPSGRTHSYSYSGGRLSEERNTAGKTVATYSYSLYADSGQNMTEASVCNDQGAATTRVWYDGFGLPVQSVALGAGADASQDVCSFTEYDGLDRPVRQWQPLPVSGTDCIYSESDLRSFASEVYGGDMRPFTETAYLASAGEKAAAVYMPGDALADYPARTEYLCNNPAIPELKVNRISINSSQTYISIPGTYPAGQLDAVKTVDPDGHTVITFTDWRGFKILERRVVAENDYLDTYYANDCWGNPLVVIQPELSARYKDKTLISLKLSSPNAAKYIFQYRYDRCGRLVSKRIPGCEPVLYRYDPYGRLAFMQDGNMRDSGRAMFTVYDEASRVAVTGMCGDHAMADSVSVPTMTAVFDGSLTSGGLCDTGYTFEGTGLLNDAKLLTATYYDSYGFLSLPLFSGLPTSSTSDANSRGLKTGSLTAVLDSSDSSSAPIATAIFYDDEERPVKAVSTTHIADTYEMTRTQYTIDSQPKNAIHTIIKNSKNAYVDIYRHVYDEAGRLKSISLNFSKGTPKTIALVTNEYNSIGQLKRTVTDGVSTSYTYNVKGAVKTISNDQLLFNQVLYYEDGDNPLYSGKISAVRDNMGKRIFSYDGVGRLLSSVKTATNVNFDPYDNEIFTAEYTYDRNSNITSVDRRGYINDSEQSKADYVDNLILSYDGNQLKQVTDNAPEILDSYSYDFQNGADLPVEYEYDSNGNLVADQNRGVSEVKYNEIGLPCRISFNNNRKIENRYSADGVKLSSDLILVGRELDDDIIIKSLIPGESTETSAAGDDAVVIPVKEKIRLKVVIDSKTYLGDYELSGDSLIRLNTPYGYFLGGNFYANVYDYQGNLAVSGGEYFCGVAQGNSYYPYGLPVRGGGITKYTPYLYGGKEFETRQGLNIYDFKARTYVPDECRFWQPDPMADDYHWLSPYAYCAGDPINNVDRDGRETKAFQNDSTMEQFTENYPDNDYINIVAHGNSDYFVVYQAGEKKRIMTSEQLVTLINDNFVTAEGNIESKESVIIQLFSCQTGKNSQKTNKSVAEILSDGMSNAFIIAPNCKLGLNSDGTVEAIIDEGIETIDNIWRVFHRGKEITINEIPKYKKYLTNERFYNSQISKLLLKTNVKTIPETIN